MQDRTLGATGLRISEIGFGCGNTAGLLTGGTIDDQRTAVQRALELGVNYFDTAPNYGERVGGAGTSEANLGRVLRDLRAHPLVGTKVELHQEDFEDIPGAVGASIEGSLQRLGLDRVDILYFHNRVGRERRLSPGAMGSRPSVDDVLGPRGVMDSLQKAQREGKARYLAFCSSGGDVEVNRQLADSGGFQAVQLSYSILNPTEGRASPAGFHGADHGQIIDYAGARGLGVVVIRVLGGGVLSGAPDPHPLNTGSRAEVEYREGALRARSLRFLAREGEQTMAQAAVRFALGHSKVSCVLVGFSGVAQVDEAVGASGKGSLPGSDLARIEALYPSDFGAA